MKYYKEIIGNPNSPRLGEDLKWGLTLKTNDTDWFLYSHRSGAWEKVGEGFMKSRPEHWRTEITLEELFTRIL